MNAINGLIKTDGLVKRIPQKYLDRIGYIDHDDDGYWIGLRDGWCWDSNGFHTIHEDTQAKALEALRDTDVCTCRDCFRSVKK